MRTWLLSAVWLAVSVARAAPVQIAAVDCTREFPTNLYFACGDVVVTNGPAGRYRETAPTEASRFGYRFTVRHPGRPHLFVVRYPDDKTRCMAISDGTAYDMSVGVFTGAAKIGNHGRDYSGLAQPFSNTMVEQRNIFWPRWTDASIVFANTTPGQPAAVASFAIFELDEQDISPLDIPKAVFPRRSFGVSFEDPCSHGADFGAATYADWLDRAVRCMKHQGQNRLIYPLVWYHGPLYPSAIDTAHYFEWSVPSPVDRKIYIRWTSHPADWPEMLLTRFDREGFEFIAQICLLRYGSLMERMNTDAAAVAAGADTVCNVWNDGVVQAGAGDWTGEYNVNNFAVQCAIREKGKSWGNAPLQYGEKIGGNMRRGPIFNPAHPEVRAAVLRNVREIAERYARHRSFKGLKIFTYGSSFLAWPSLACGYDDVSIARFEKETGCVVDAPKAGAERFMARYKTLTAPPLRRVWIDWRCRVVADLVRDIQCTLRNVRPDLEFTVQLNRARECGVDPTLWRGIGVPDVVGFGGVSPCAHKIKPDVDMRDISDVNIYNTWIERWGKHTWWRCAPGEPVPLSMAFLLGQPAEGICRMGSSFEPDGFWWPDAQMRITPAFSGGVHYMRHFANAVATCDAFTLVRGGLTFDRAHADLLRPFARAFRALPRVKFETLAGTACGNAVVRTQKAEGARWLYLVNREYVPCDVTLRVEHPRDGLENGCDAVRPAAEWKIHLEPYALRSFAFPSECSFAWTATDVPPTFASDLEKRAATALTACADSADARDKAYVAEVRGLLSARDWPVLRCALERRQF